MRACAARLCLALGAALAAFTPLPAGSEPPAAQAPASAAQAKPRHIMSISQCTDMILLQLVPRDRIASVTYLAEDAIAGIDPALDDGVAINHGTAEEIVTQKPDLIFAGDFSTRMTREVARKAGAPLIEVKSARTFQDIRDNVRRMGAAVGEPGRAEVLIARMDQVLAHLSATAPPKPYVVAAWSGDSVPGKATLANTIIEAAGAVNVASLLDNERYNSFGLEQLLAADPDVLMYGRRTTERPALVAERVEHPVLRHRFAGRAVTYPESFLNCGVPQSAEAALDIRRALTAIAGRGG